MSVLIVLISKAFYPSHSHNFFSFDQIQAYNNNPAKSETLQEDPLAAKGHFL